MIFPGLTLKDWFHKVIKTPPVCHQNLKNRIEQWRALDFYFFLKEKCRQEMHSLQDFKQIGYFKVRNSPIPKLPDYLFMGLSIVHLTFFDCGELKLLTICWCVDYYADYQLTQAVSKHPFEFYCDDFRHLENGVNFHFPSALSPKFLPLISVQ